MTKEEKIKSFDPNNPGAPENNLFGLPFTNEESEILVLPLPWEVTVSYRAGTSKGPGAIFDASFQVDLFDEENPDFWKKGIGMLDAPAKWLELNKVLRQNAEVYINWLINGKDKDDELEMTTILNEINAACDDFHHEVYLESKKVIEQNKMIVGLGGDHSTPFGIIKAYAEKYSDFGILHFDAHMDLRHEFEGFKWSHASIFNNVITKIPAVEKLVSVGIRDYCEQENDFVKQHSNKIKIITDKQIKKQQFNGDTLNSIHKNITDLLPKNVYISFDIDALDVRYCPNTGTPVPGGLEFTEAINLIETVKNSGRNFVGFDINEVTPGNDEWDANVGARLLYKIASIVSR